MKQHRPKLTVFVARGQPFCNIRKALRNIARRTGGGCDVSEGSASSGPVVLARFDRANAGQYPHTVARKSAIRLRSEHQSTEAAPGTKRDTKPIEASCGKA